MEEVLKQLAQEVGVTKLGVITCQDIIFRQELRDICESNQCGMYGKSWCCPPAIGTISKAKEKIVQYEKGLVIQTVQQLEDPFDIEGMMAGKTIHKEKLLTLLQRIKRKYPHHDFFPMSVGGCDHCKNCAYTKGKPCVFPNQAIPGMEGYGIDVQMLTKRSGLAYNNGPQTVSYISFIGW